MPADLPSHHKALVLEAKGAALQVQTVPTPEAGTGTVVVRVIAAGVLSYQREVYGGERSYAFPMPLVGGFSAIARVAAVGPDATLVQPGQLVFVDCVIRARDDPSARYLTAIHEGGSDGSKKLMRDVWRNGAFAEYLKAPLENCIPLNEARLCEELGYSAQDLMYICYLLVGFGGLRDIKAEPGETVVVCPATGGFGGAGVQVAVAMGARVIAMGRNEKELARLKEHVKKGTPWASIETVKITGDESADTAALQAFGTIDAVLDLSPPGAMKSTHLRSAILALRQGGRCSLMGFAPTDFMPAWKVISDDITMKGKLMYSREDMLLFVKMLERGLFPKGKDFVDAKTYTLENWKEAFDVAADFIGVGRHVMITP
jgi:threonine dehydrogenase-like Zn-dependent dehydrogenase